MATVRILSVEGPRSDDPDVLSAEIAPAAGDEFPGYEFDARALIELDSVAPSRVELIADGDEGTPVTILHSTPRGFRGTASVLGLPERFTLELVAVSADERRVPVATILGERDRLETGYSPSIQPIMLMSHGRSGATWVTHLLGKHPEVVTYAPFQFEPRLGSYWLSVLKTLAEPASRSQFLDPRFRGNPWWTGVERPAPPVETRRDPPMLGWVAAQSVEGIAAFCQEQIDRFYTRAARAQEKANPAYFAERALMEDWFTAPLYRELYPGAPEVYLVRDFRDVVCSLLSFETDILGRSEPKDPEATRGLVAQLGDQLLGAWRQRGERSFLLRYEHLMREPEETLTALFEFLALDATAATVAGTLRDAESAKPERQEAHRTTTSSEESIGRWRRELSPEMQLACSEAFAEPLRQFGYES